MKKTINVLVEKLTENEKGQFTGGFGSIKGGFSEVSANILSANSGCSNPTDCRGSGNTGGCTNSGLC